MTIKSLLENVDLDRLPQLPADKANHAFYGSMIALLVLVLCGWVLGCRAFDSAFFALSAVILCAGLKEGYDAAYNVHVSGDWLTGPHEVSLLDFLATCAGGLPVCLPLLVTTYGLR